MAASKTSKTKKQQRVSRTNLEILILSVAVFLSIVGNLIWFMQLRSNVLEPKRNSFGRAAFSIHPNLACTWQDMGMLSDGLGRTVQRVTPYSLYQGYWDTLPEAPIATHRCNFLLSDTDNVDLYGMSVIYFENNEEAQGYADQEINPKKFWSPGKDGDTSGVFSYLTISDEGRGVPQLAEAYMVKDDMVIELSLPCQTEADTSNEAAESCDEFVRSYMRTSSRLIDQTYGGQDQNPFRNQRF